MDSRPTIIGSGPNSQYARKNKESEKKDYGKKQTKQLKPSSKSKPRPVELIHVYIGSNSINNFVGTIGLKPAVRFSEEATMAFPKPLQIGEHDKPESGDAKREEAGGQGGDHDLDAGERGSEEQESETSSNAPLKKVLILNLSDVAQQPSAQAVVNCLAWIEANKSKHDEPLTKFTPPKGSNISLLPLVDRYAAALSFGMRPFPLALRNEIMDLLNTEKPLQADVQYISEHLPTGDSITKRMVTAYFECRENDEYADEEAEAIFDYVESVEALSQRFLEVEQSRERFRKREEKAQRSAEARGKAQVEWEAAVGRVRGAGNGGASNGDRQRTRRPQNIQGDPKPAAKAINTEPKADKAGATGRQAEAKPRAARWEEAMRRAGEVAKKQGMTGA
ncbi:hypothetical protein LTR36_001786 [Oleoguttula mirabilis]|uniref:Uncharacterized protein n=1 Tax=Oleoguttula mirabilis TaxID=1507867 RepID=A0AAV9JMH7_9PEZI|nr:hypothetical protein LTR36_001786 [Oleoguttula mirabilis]